MWRRIWTILKARNHEFFRDKSSFGWNFVFPFLIIAGFTFIFTDNNRTTYKVGVVHSEKTKLASELPIAALQKYQHFKKIKHIEFIEFETKEDAMSKLRHHGIDFLINPGSYQYWVSKSSPNGYMVEKLFHSNADAKHNRYKKLSIDGREIPYVEWLFPGILGMNMMFSGLFGVGLVVIRYRKNGALKRLSVTPLKPYEFLTAQIISRMYVILFATLIVFVGCTLIFRFECHGSYLNLFIVFFLGGFSMISLGLVVASRSSSEEFAHGILNFITWPMMFFSEVWFSLEGSHPWVYKFSRILPLTQLIDGARRIMNDGAGLFEIKSQIITLAVMSGIFMMFGSMLFKWQKD